MPYTPIYHLSTPKTYQLFHRFVIVSGRHAIHTHISPVQTYLVLTAYSPQSKVKSADGLSGKGLVCVWNVNEPTKPQKILVCESQPTCCCFSPVKSTLVFAGMVDGSVVVWDLREPNSMHRSMHIEKEAWTVRYPTYSTGKMKAFNNNWNFINWKEHLNGPFQSIRFTLLSYWKIGVKEDLTDACYCTCEPWQLLVRPVLLSFVHCFYHLNWFQEFFLW